MAQRYSHLVGGVGFIVNAIATLITLLSSPAYIAKGDITGIRFAYIVALMINQFGRLFMGNSGDVGSIIGLVFAFAAFVGIIYMLVRPYKEATKLTTKVKVKA